MKARKSELSLKYVRVMQIFRLLPHIVAHIFLPTYVSGTSSF